MMHRPVERYVRTTIPIRVRGRAIGSVEAGLQYQQGEDIDRLRATLRGICESTINRNEGEWDHFDASMADGITEVIEACLAKGWGADRGRFVEVWRGADGAEECLIQVYAPCGMPRAG